MRRDAKEVDERNKKQRSFAATMPLVLLGFILVGALLLMLPISSVSGTKTTFTEAIFTATTSVCVTGSTVVDTATHWTAFGQVIIIMLVQLGGLGVLTMVLFTSAIIGHKLSFENAIMLQDMFTLDTAKGISGFVINIIKVTVSIELAGAIAYMFIFVPDHGLKGIWYSIFNSISAFCNAGLCVIKGDNLATYNSDPAVMIITMLLIVIGGIGFIVWIDMQSMVSAMRKNRRLGLRQAIRHLKEHTRLAISITLVLIFGGAAIIFLLEFNNPDTIGQMSTGDKIMNCIFQSVTFRTAGFTTIPQEELTEASSAFGAFLMFIGGSPVGTAGGVKTITMYIVLINVLTFIRNKNEVVSLRRKIPEETINKSNAIVTMQFLVMMVLCMALMVTSDASLSNALYEINSATNTVGLSRDLTDELNTTGKWIVMVAMFYGRIGPLSMMLFFQPRTIGEDGINHAEGRFIVG